MAGGMTPGRPHLGLAERLAGTHVRTAAGRPTPPSRTPPPDERSAGVEPGDAARPGPLPRHVWVDGLPELSAQCPGLLAEWRRADGRWSGRVVYAVAVEDSVVLVEAWVPARHLRPAQA